jgi:glycerate kinase
MRIVIAPDSFKESLSALDVAHAIAAGVRDVAPNADVVCIPMADGGEGSLDSLLAACEGERRKARVKNANAHTAEADWGWLGEARAFIEIATAAGLAQISPTQRNALTATSYGVGQLIIEALDAGARHITVGLGGSACNDGGAGMLQALGAQLLDSHGTSLPLGGGALSQLHSIVLDELDPRLAQTTFEIAMDVNNPLCGPQGASAVFGPQKGASAQQVDQLDAALAHFAKVCTATVHKDESQTPGVGAAGGLGFGIKTFFNATFKPGVELLAELAGLPQAMVGADLVFTGEGRMDAQTLHGKTPAGVARCAQQLGVPVIAIVGSLGDGYQALYDIGLTAAFSLAPGPITLEQACQDAPRYLRQRAADCLRLWQAGHNKD